MKTTRILLFIQLLLAASLTAQNWNVFNRAYRYNYKYNNSALVSQVLFADSTRSAGTYTTDYLNRIGVECMGTCPTITTALSQTLAVIVPNMPQFLQREITTYSSGYMVLRDTAKLVLIPNCQPGQSWLFDSSAVINASCVSKGAQLIFGMPDSVKLILIGGTDTLKLSKNFGILQFPTLYAKNKYYRLVGIENAASYNLTALYGEKVPNAWDIYNFDVGDRFCYRNSTEYTMHSGYFVCESGDFSVLSKTVTPNGYQYGVSDVWTTCQGHVNVSPNMGSPGSSTTRNYLNLTSAVIPTNNPFPDLLSPANQMYPGQVLQGSDSYQLVHFATDAQGRFYKYAGLGCSSQTSFGQIPFPLLSYTTPCSYGYNQVAGYLQEHQAVQSDVRLFSVIYGSGIGLVARKSWSNILGQLLENTVECAVKNGTLYLGNANYVGIKEQHLNAEDIKIYPNPTQDKINVSTGSLKANELRVISLLGENVMSLHEDLYKQDLVIDLSASAPGIYFIQILQNGVTLSSKKVVRN